MSAASSSPSDLTVGLVQQVIDVRANDVHETKVNSRVSRLHCATNGTVRSFIAKRLDPDIARRNECVALRWLPAIGLRNAAPALLAVAAEPDGRAAWHLYEDLGDYGLDAGRPDLEAVARAVTVIAQIHLRFSGHALIPECRLWGGDLGISFYDASVRDAITSLEAVLARRRPLSGERSSLCRRLLARLTRLLEERASRAEVLERSGGAETLLHGDLWPMNVIVDPTSVRLIDWDHAAVGPVSYDLSTFLSRFPPSVRPRILRLYEDELVRAGGRLSPVSELNVMFETAELARIANRVIWPALAVWEDDADWGFGALDEVEAWFEQLTAVLPPDRTCAPS
jgi:Phosphotransferase enzyme family